MVGLGLFAPLPLAVMIPFMAGQSFAMGEAFGKGFQYGKRKVSSMTNEQFNASSAPQMFAETTADITQMIPTMQNAMEKFHTLQTDIILKMIDYIAKLPAEVLPAVTEGLTNIDWADIIKTLTTSGASTSGKLIEDLTKMLSVQQAHASLAPSPLIQTPDTSTQIKLQNEIDRLKQQVSASSNPNVSKVIIKGNIETKYNNKGQVISVNVINPNLIPKSQTAQSTSAQTIVKSFVKPKPRAPRSVVIQIRKYEQAIIANTNIINALFKQGRLNTYPAWQNAFNNRKRAQANMAVLKAKYKF